MLNRVGTNMNSRLNEIYQLLIQDSSVSYMGRVFRLFIDNKIDEEELFELLNMKGYSLPDSFYQLPKPFQKDYLAVEKKQYFYQDDSWYYYLEPIFNRYYFFDLVEHARKNKALTHELSKYAGGLFEHSIGYGFYCMHFIKIKYSILSYIGYKSILDYAKERNIIDLYSLTTSLMMEVDKKYNPMKLLLKEALKRLLKLDLDAPYISFTFNVECALSLVSRKETNTLKIFFKILDKEKLREIDYYDDPKVVSRLLKKFKTKLINHFNLVYSIKSLPKDELFNQSNGYSAVYYFFMEERLC